MGQLTLPQGKGEWRGCLPSWLTTCELESQLLLSQLLPRNLQVPALNGAEDAGTKSSRFGTWQGMIPTGAGEAVSSEESDERQG